MTENGITREEYTQLQYEFIKKFATKTLLGNDFRHLLLIGINEEHSITSHILSGKESDIDSISESNMEILMAMVKILQDYIEKTAGDIQKVPAAGLALINQLKHTIDMVEDGLVTGEILVRKVENE